MLTLSHNGEQYPIQNTEYYVRELASGLDEIIFDISIYDPIYAILSEEEQIVDRAGQAYLVKQIDAGADMAKVVCQIDIDAWKSTMYVDYNSGSKTCVQQIEAVKPTGWTVQDHATIGISRTIKGSYTAYEICTECTGIYGVYIRWDNVSKICHIYSKAMGSPVGAFATRELNLKEINYKGKSNNLATRLYAYGKDGLSFADINSGKPYVDNNVYDTRVICAYWQDDRYTDAASLLADAQTKLTTLAVPERSYECSIVDLQATNPTLYNNLDFSLFKVATLIDDIKNTAVNYQVVERHIWPYHPEDNEVIFDNSPQKITAAVVSVQDSIENPNSTFQQIQEQRIAEATNWLLSGDGYVVAVQDSDGTWKELLFMDTNDISTAQDVLRINKNGIGFSTNGANGPYTNAWTIDGNLVADFITTGTMLADRIKGGTLEVGGYSNEDGVIKVYGSSSRNSGTFTGSTVWTAIGYNALWGETQCYVDIEISSISDPSLFNHKYNLFKTTDGSNFTQIDTGQLHAGINRVSVPLDIVNDGNVYYQVSIQRYNSEYTATFNYNVLLNYPHTTINKDGVTTTNIKINGGTLNINNVFTVDAAGNMVANSANISGVINASSGTISGNLTLGSSGSIGSMGNVNDAFLMYNGSLGVAVGINSSQWGGLAYGKEARSRIPGWTTNALASMILWNGGQSGAGFHVISGSPNGGDTGNFSALKQSSLQLWANYNLVGEYAQGGFYPSSDRRLKKKIKIIGRRFVKQFFKLLNPVSFVFKHDDKYTRYGVIAQEIEDVLNILGVTDSQFVKENETGYKSVNYTEFIGLELAGVKHLYEIVEKQGQQIEALKAEVKALKSKL